MATLAMMMLKLISFATFWVGLFWVCAIRFGDSSDLGDGFIVRLLRKKSVTTENRRRG